MAALPDQQAVDATAELGSVDGSEQYSDDPTYGPPVSDDVQYQYEYQEHTETHSVPTKSGFEDEMQVDNDRPGSAGTALSTQLEEDDEEFLASMAASNKQEINDVTIQPTASPFFSRRAPPLEANVPQDFAYGKASIQQLDFQGTRKVQPAPAAISQAESTQPDSEPETVDEVNTVDSPTQGDSEVQSQEDLRSDDAYNHDQPPDRNETHDAIVDEETGSMPQLPQPESDGNADDAASFAAASTPMEAETTDQNLHHVDQDEVFEDAAEDRAIVEDVSRQTTSVQPTPIEDQQVCPSSPHSQLQEDAALQQSTYLHEMNEPDFGEPNDQLSLGRSLPPPAQTRTAQASHQGQITEAPRSSKAKKSSKASRQAHATAISDPDINDYVQIVLFKMREQSQNAAANANAERNAIQQELEQLLEAKQILEDELSKVVQDNDALSSTCDKQKAKLANYEERVRKFKKFIDGLGRDVDSLKREANATRRKGEDLVQEIQDCKVEREALLEQMNSCMERSSQLKNEALRACSDTQRDLQEAVTRASYLDKQLNEKVGLLAEERDRRAQLERRLLSASDPSETILRAMKTNNDAMFDKLHLLHATMEDTNASNKISDMLGQTLDAVQAVSSQTTTSADDAALTKGLVEALSDRLVEIEDQSSTQPLKRQLDDVLAGLKGLADHQQDRVRQDAAHRESFNGLHEKLKDSNVRNSSVEQELQSAQAREGLLKEDNQKLQSKIAAFQSHPVQGGDAQVQSDETRIELQAKVKALDTATSNLAIKAAELDGLRKTNEKLVNAKQSLQQKIDELEQTRNDLVPETQAIEARIRSEVERERADALKHAQEYCAQQDMETKNKLKKLTSDRDRYEKQITPLKAELATSKRQVEELQKETAEGTASNEQLEQAKKLARSQTKEIENLKSSLGDLQQSAKVDATLKEKLASISTDLNTERTKLEEAAEEKTALLNRADRHVHDANEAKKTCEQVKAELVTYRADTGVQVEKLREALKAAQEAQRHAEAGKEHFRKSCDSAIEKEKSDGRRKVEDLQTALTEKEAELGKTRKDDEDFRAQVDEEWQVEATKQDQKQQDLRSQIQEAETAKGEALASNERSIEERRMLLDQVDVLKQRLTSTEEKLKKHQQSPAQAPEAPPRLKVPSLSEGITPSASDNSTAPTRPRKKVDRKHSLTVDASALPVPDVLRPISGRAGSSKGRQAVQKAIIEDSQAAETPPTREDDGEAARSGSGYFAMFSDVDATQIADSFPSQHPTERIEETQIDNLPSITAFDRSLSGTHIPGLNQMSSSLSVSYDNNHQVALGALQRASQAGQRPSNNRIGDGYALRQPDNNFSIYEDTHNHDDGGQKSLHDSSSAHPRDVLDWSQEERDKYTFRKAMPQPNSASKIVRGESHSSAGGERRPSDMQQRAPLRERRLETPEVCGNSTHSSSPAYLQPASSRPGRTYSNTPGGSGKRKSTRTQSFPSQDPRLVGRNPSAAPKRKAESSIVEGYEHERKKRLSAAANATSSGTSRPGLRSDSQQLLSDLPAIPTMPANPRGSSSQSRLRTLAGGVSRAPVAKKTTKNDEMRTRFSQEFGRR